LLLAAPQETAARAAEQRKNMESVGKDWHSWNSMEYCGNVRDVPARVAVGGRGVAHGAGLRGEAQEHRGGARLRVAEGPVRALSGDLAALGIPAGALAGLDALLAGLLLGDHASGSITVDRAKCSQLALAIDRLVMEGGSRVRGEAVAPGAAPE
jgi:hypothetical protein